MPGTRRWNPSEEPFNYKKLCTAVPIFVFAVILLLSFVGMDGWLPSSKALSVAIIGLISLATYLFFLKGVWMLLPGNIRARIPYDRNEADNSKGDIRSLRELFRVLFF